VAPSSGLPMGAKVALGALVLAMLGGGAYYVSTRGAQPPAKPNRAPRRRSRGR
jgi:hypothetical protein